MNIGDLRPGDIGFGPIKGGAGLLVTAGQLMLGEGFRIGALNIGHVFVVTEASEGGPSHRPHLGPSAVEAMPSGAREVGIVSRWTPEYAYVRLPEDYPGQAQDAAAIARAMVGTPYSFASYVALAAWKLGIGTPRLTKWINRRRPHRAISGYTGPAREGEVFGLDAALPAEAICSVLADQAWSLTGKKIMRGVGEQCVTPGALAGRLMDPAMQWFWPGRS